MSANPEPTPEAAAPRGVYLYDWEYNGRDDSDFYLLYWSFEKGEPVRVEYDSTRYASGGDGSSTKGIVGWNGHGYSKAEVPPEAREWFRLRVLSHLGDAEVLRITEPRGEIPKGTRVVFTKPFSGRKAGKVAAGATGVVVWSGADAWSVPRYKNSYKRTTYRAGVKLDGEDRTVFVTTKSLRLDEDPAPLAELEEKAARIAAAATGESFYSFFRTALYSLL